MRIVRDQDSVGLLDFFCNCLIIHFLLLPFLFDSRGQDFCNISQDCHALILDLARKEVELVVHADVPRMRQAMVSCQKGSWMNIGVMRPTPSSMKRIFASLCDAM